LQHVFSQESRDLNLNQVFTSPTPNRQLWNTHTVGLLQAQDFLYHGGWWHNPNILAACGEGIEIEEPRAWKGRWNETVVDLCRLSKDDPQTLNILLTGRNEDRFKDLIGRMIASRGLEFDMVVLKPTVGPNGQKWTSTMLFKQAFLKDVIFTYATAEEIRVYEDRPKHTKGFRDFFTTENALLMAPAALNSTPGPRPAINAEVIQVAELESTMNPESEVAEVQRMINTHNQAILDNRAPPGATPHKIKRSVFFTGYLIPAADIEKLKALVKLPANCPEHEIKYLANNILITPKPAPRSILDKVGGIGAKMKWKVTGLASYEQRVWAARVAPVVPGTKFHTDNHTPCIVLATRRNTKPIDATRIQNWQPVPAEQAFEFETTVGEKVLLRIEEEFAHEDEWEASFPHSRNARKHPREEDFPPLGSSRPSENSKPRPQHRSYSNQAGSGAWQNSRPAAIGFAAQRGGSGMQNRGRGGGPTNRGYHRGRGGGPSHGRGRGRGGYKSLDDNVGQGYGGGSMQY
jgi:hypothetical protein